MSQQRLFVVIIATIAIAGFLAIGLNKIYHQTLDLGMRRRSLRTDLSEEDEAEIPEQSPRNYHATGSLYLPHSNIKEPFEVWYAGDFNLSRIDYYFGKRSLLLI